MSAIRSFPELDWTLVFRESEGFAVTCGRWMAMAIWDRVGKILYIQKRLFSWIKRLVMNPLSLITDMFRHMAWADALVMSTISGRPAAELDGYILDKLRHLHMVQSVFLDVWRGEPFDPRVADSLDLRALAAFARDVHVGSMRFLESLTPEALERVIELPWSAIASDKLGFRVADHSVADALVQVPQHSAYHRGQVSARLRELGVDPPMTDFIAWIWRHKPEPTWPDVC